MKKLLSIVLTLCMLIPCLSPLATEISAAETDFTQLVEEIIFEDIVIFEGTSMTDRYEYDKETGDAVRYRAYSYCPEGFTVRFKDGSAQDFSITDGGFNYNDIFYPVTWTDDQSDTNAWGLGDHTVTARLCGTEAQFTVTVLETPVERAEAETVFRLTTDAYQDYDVDPETGEQVFFYKYSCNPKYFTVYFKDGSSCICDGCQIEYNGRTYVIEYDDNQSYRNPWKEAGTYTATAKIMGVEVPITVEIAQFPFERIEASDVEIIEFNDTYLRREEDGIEYPCYNADARHYTVYLADGSYVETEHRWFEYNGKDYYIDLFDDQTYENRWGVGEHTVRAALGGTAIETEYTVSIIENPIERIEAGNVKIVEGANRSWRESNIGPDGSMVRWDAYFYNPDVTVYLKDGTHFLLEDGFEYNGNTYWLQTDDDQSLDNQWGIGEHTVKYSLLGIETEAVVEIIENPVERIEANDIRLMSGESMGEAWDESGNLYLKYFYGIGDITLYFKDGTTDTVRGNYEYEGTGYWCNTTDDQSANNLWDVGDHTATVSFMGLETQITVTIYESPIERIQVEDINIFEGSNLMEDYVYDQDGNLVQFTRYSFNPDFTVYFTDGHYEYCRDGVVIDGKYFMLEMWDDQSAENIWGLGPHTVHASLFGVETEFTVNITESPIDRFEVDGVITLIEDADCYERYWQDPETGEWVLGYCYSYYISDFTVYFTDGTSQKCHEYIEFMGEYYTPECHDNQQQEPWGVGEHTVTASLFGKETEFTVVVEESPVERIEVPNKTVREGFDGYTTMDGFEYYKNPDDFTVYFKDGTSATVSDFIRYNDRYYYVGFSEVDDEGQPVMGGKAWKLGEKHRFRMSILGCDAYYTVTVVENPYTALSVSGGNELILTLERKDGKGEEYKIVSVAPFSWDSGIIYYTATSESGEIFRIAAKSPGVQGMINFRESLQVIIGTLESNTVPGNIWMDIAYCSEAYGRVLRSINGIIKDVLGVDFNGYDGTVTDENLDSLIMAAAYLCLDRLMFDIIFDESNQEYMVISAEDMERALTEVFGAENVDITKSSFYKNGSIVMPFKHFGADDYVQRLDYKDGSFLLTYTEEGFGEVLVTMNEDAQILNITYDRGGVQPDPDPDPEPDPKPEPDPDPKPEVKKGDINGDGKVNAIDSNLMKRIIMGVYAPNAAADVNGDGKYNSIDSNLIKRIIMGTYKPN